MFRKIVTTYWVVRILLRAEEIHGEVVRLISLMVLAVFSGLWLVVTAMGVLFDLPGVFAEVMSIGMWASAVVYCAAV